MSEKPTERIWTCKIGGPVGELPRQPDFTMRKAVIDAFRSLTGVDAEYCFSGWGATLSDFERAVVENHDPTMAELAKAELAKAEAIRSLDLDTLAITLGMSGPDQSIIDQAVYTLQQPIDMVLHCPACGMQHIDEPEGEGDDEATVKRLDVWTNPPHRSHLCHGCGHIWRPADVPTNGVAAVKTKGKDDSPVVTPAALAAERRKVAELEAELALRRKSGSAVDRLHNLYEGIAADADGSEWSREEWERIDAENADLRRKVAELLGHEDERPRAYLIRKLQMVMPLLEEARDALPAITEQQRVLRGISATLADRMDEAGTYSVDDWRATEGGAT